MKKALEIIPFFLFLIPAFLIAHIEREYQHLITYTFVTGEIIELFAVAPVVAGTFFLIVRNLRRACAYALPVLITFYFFCDLKDALHSWNDRSFFSSYQFLLPAILILLVSILAYLRKSQSEFKKLFLFVNVLFIFLIAYESLVPAIVYSSAQKSTTSKGIFNNANYCDTCVRPDIYYLVFDAYTSSKVLKEEFNYDNSQIDTFLKRRNFYLIPNSTSNYNLTPFSIGSTLNLDYLYTLNTNKAFYLNDYLPGVSIVYQNQLIPALRKLGYKIVNHSIFRFDDAPPTVPAFDLWELNLIYERHNIFRKIDRDIGGIIRQYIPLSKKKKDHLFIYEQERDNHFTRTVSALLETIKSRTNSPKFTYGHLLLPHSPYTYDSLGGKIRLHRNKMTVDEVKNAYVNQLVYCNKVIKNLLDEIFLHPKKPFIVILQGDHGFKYETDSKRELEFSNLNAIYFYNQDYRSLHDSLSNVNTFRCVSNTFFNTNLPLLKDTSYFLQYK